MTLIRNPKRPAKMLALCAAVFMMAAPAMAQDAKPTQMEVTVYSGNLAMIRESRDITLAKGRNEIPLTGVSPSMQPSSASVDVTATQPVSLVDQVFAFDLLTPETLLRHSVGDTVRVIRTNPATGAETTEDAKVLSARNGIVLQIGDRIETGVPGRIVFEKLPPSLRAEPTLIAAFQVNAETKGTLDLRYLTSGISWQADYVAQLHESGAQLSLQAVATITNNSGAAYEDAALRLVAGTVNQPAGDVRPVMQAVEAKRGLAAAAPVAPQPVGDMHLYAIPEKVTLGDNETRQIVLFEAAHVPVTKEYRIVGNGAYHVQRFPTPLTVNAERLLKFKDNEKSELGVPMPAGIVRVYGATETVSDTFLGADRINHTARGEEVTLTLGTAFDITAERRQTEYKTQGLPKNTFETSHEIKIRNATTRPVTVKVIERLPGDWEILETSNQYKKISADQAEWLIAIPGGEQKTLTYTARVKR
ncbi:MAG: DUF4139 domain-containing protein [Pseudomonadota bacterium]